MSTSNRSQYIDFAKGLGIILVVIGHACVPSEEIGKMIYLFHMPMFFLISGILYNGNSDLKTYIKKKVLSLYIPFVVWNVLFTIIESIVFHENTVTTIKTIIPILLTLSHEKLCFDPTWFIASLFQISILYKILDNSLKKSKYADIHILLIFYVLKSTFLTFWPPYELIHTFYHLLFFAIGVVIKKRIPAMKEEMSNTVSSVWIIIALIACVLMHRHYPDLTYKNNTLLFILACSTSFSVLFFSKQITEFRNKFVSGITKCFTFLGRHSLDILIWHYVAFRITMLILLLINGKSITVTSFFDYDYSVLIINPYDWIIYIITGIILPIAFCCFMRMNPWGKITKKIHIF